MVRGIYVAISASTASAVFIDIFSNSVSNFTAALVFLTVLFGLLAVRPHSEIWIKEEKNEP